MKAAPLVAVFDGWGLMLMVSGDLPHVKPEYEPPLYGILMHVAELLRTLVFG